MIRRISSLSIAAGFVFTGAVVAQQDATPPTRQATTHKMSTDSTRSADLSSFAKKAAEGGLAEVELGRLAADKASSERVKQFAQKMVDDHSKANEDLKEAAKKENIDLPSSLDKKDQAEVDKLSKLSGAAFDKAYMSAMVKDHEKDVSEFRKAARSGGSSEVKSFAQNTLPTLEEHLKLARDVEKEVGGSHSAKNSPSSKS